MEGTKKSGFSTAGLVLGIIGLCTSFIPIINNLSFFLGILSIIFGIIAFAKKDSKGKIIAVIILGILAVAVTINSQKELSDAIGTMTGDKTQEILANSVDVTFGDFEVNKGQYTTNTKLTVKVTNKTSENKSFNIQVEAVNPDGSRIMNDYVYANNLNAGQTQNFDIFTLVSSDKIETMKNATFKVVEASMH